MSSYIDDDEKLQFVDHIDKWYMNAQSLHSCFGTEVFVMKRDRPKVN